MSRPDSSHGPAGRLGARTPDAKWRVQVAEIQSAVDEAAQLAEEVTDVIDETLSGGAPSPSIREEDVGAPARCEDAAACGCCQIVVNLCVNALVRGRASCLHGRRQIWSAQRMTSSGSHVVGCGSARTYAPVCVSRPHAVRPRCGAGFGWSSCDAPGWWDIVKENIPRIKVRGDLRTSVKTVCR